MNNNLYITTYNVEIQTKAPRAKKVKSINTRTMLGVLRYTNQIERDELVIEDYDSLVADNNALRFYYDLSPVFTGAVASSDFVRAIFTKTCELESEDNYTLIDLLRLLPKEEAIQYFNDKLIECNVKKEKAE